MSQQLRIGIIGMGIGRQNARALAANPRAVVTALCDLEQQRMDEVARELPEPVESFTDYKALCRDSRIDAVFIGSPNQLHVPMGLEAVHRGKHILVTKPLADTEQSAAELVEAAEKAGVVAMMSLSTRFSPAVRHLGATASDGDFGELYYARARSIRRSGIPAWNLGFIQCGGGAFRDMGVHALDAAWWLLGRPEPVSITGVAGARFGPRGMGYWDFKAVSREVYRHYESDDYAGGFVRFDGGIGLQIESFWASHQPPEFQIELFGTEAGARLQPLSIYRTHHHVPHDTTINLPKGPSAWDNIAAHFIDCCLDGVVCEAPVRDGLMVQRMLEALLDSTQKGREVRLDGSRCVT